MLHITEKHHNNITSEFKGTAIALAQSFSLAVIIIFAEILSGNLNPTLIFQTIHQNWSYSQIL